MKRSIACLSLCLLAATAALTLPAAGRSPAKQEVDPDTLRILWADEEQLWPNFIPQALIGELDLTSPETVDLSHLPMTESQKASFKYFLFYEPDTPDGCLRDSIAIRAPGPKDRSLSVVEALAWEPLITAATVRKVVPGWITGNDTPANLIFAEVGVTFRDLDHVAAPGRTLVFLQTSGAELTVGGKRICSPRTGSFEATVGIEVLLFGLPSEVEDDVVLGRAYEIRESMVHPDPHHKLLKESETQPIPVWELSEKLADLPGTNR